MGKLCIHSMNNTLCTSGFRDLSQDFVPTSLHSPGAEASEFRQEGLVNVNPDSNEQQVQPLSLVGKTIRRNVCLSIC